jgi:subtilisin family serine protease
MKLLEDLLTKTAIAYSVAIAIFAVPAVSTAQVLALPVLLDSSQPAYVPGEVLVKYRSLMPGLSAGIPSSARSQVLETILTPTMRRSGEAAIYRLKVESVPDALQRLRVDPQVEYAEPNWIVGVNYTSNDPYYTNGNLWGMYGASTSPANQFGSHAGAAWANNNVGNNSVVVGVIDEGIDFSHPDLSPNAFVNPYDPVDGIDNDGNGYVDDTHGWDFVNNDRTVYDGGNGDKHGTHVAGTIGARGGNGAGVAGVCWNVTMISCKFLGRNGGTIANAIRAVDYLTDLKWRHGLNLVASNNSWGGGGFSQGMLDAITRGANQNILFVAAAGNGGSDGVGDDNDKFASYPSGYNTTPSAGYDAVIAVASITSTGTKSGFSNYGATTVDLGAPGSSINSTLPKNSYGSYSGTSMATPHVTGGIALYRATHVATAAQTRNAILSTTIPTSSLNGRTVTGGRLNVSSY